MASLKPELCGISARARCPSAVSHEAQCLEGLSEPARAPLEICAPQRSARGDALRGECAHRATFTGDGLAHREPPSARRSSSAVIEQPRATAPCARPNSWSPCCIELAQIGRLDRTHAVEVGDVVDAHEPRVRRAREAEASPDPPRSRARSREPTACAAPRPRRARPGAACVS